MSRPTKEKLSMKCVLTDAERLVYASQMSETFNDKLRKEEEFKFMSQQFKSEFSGMEAKISAIASKLTSGTEYREVECEIVYDFEIKTRRWIRLDTGEIYKEDIIPESMLQEEAPL